MDLAVWWRERRFRGLLDLIDQLPGASRTHEAILNDPEQAHLIARAREAAGPDGAKPWAPRVSEFDLHAAMLRDVIEMLGAIQHTLARSKKQPPSYPSPVTEVDRAVERLQTSWAVGLLGKFGFDPSDVTGA